MLQRMRNLLTQPTHELGRWSRFLIFQIRIWFHCFRLLGVNRCMTQAAALAYHSIFGLVPLAIVILMVFQMFPANREAGIKTKNLLYESLNLTRIEYPAEEDATLPEQVPSGEEEANEAKQTITVAEKLDELIVRYMSKVNAGAITGVGLVLVIWAAIGLLVTTERAFNNIYHVGAGRSFLNRLFNYWALLTLGPLLIGAGLYISTRYLLASELSRGIFTYLGPVGPFLISALAFFLLYYFLPNTHVSARSALWGAFVATVLWTAAKYGLRIYMSKVVMYRALYGILGIIPLTVFWIFVSWLIVLFGLQLTYATQNIKRLDEVELEKARKQEKCFLANDQTVVRIMEYVLNAFEQKDQKPVSIEAVAYRMSMPMDFTEKVLQQMVTAGLLCRTDNPSVGYVPSTDGTHIKLDEISAAISEISFAQPDVKTSDKLRQVFEEVRGNLSKYSLKEVLRMEEDFRPQEPPAPFDSQDDRGV